MRISRHLVEESRCLEGTVCASSDRHLYHLVCGFDSTIGATYCAELVTWNASSLTRPTLAALAPSTTIRLLP